MNSKIATATLLIVATLTMFFTPAMAPLVQGDHPEAEAERVACVEESYNMEIKHRDDSLEDSESFKEQADFKSECNEKFYEHTEPDFD